MKQFECSLKQERDALQSRPGSSRTRQLENFENKTNTR